VVRPGFKANMLDLEAALGVVQLRKLDRFNAARSERAARYTELLADVPQVRPLGRVPYEHVHAWHLFIVRLDLAALTIDRDAFIAELRARGVGAGLHFTPVHDHVWYRERYGPSVDRLPVTTDAGERILSLPLFPTLSDEEQDRVVTAVADVVARSRR
jgi:UDP-4-amino-4-deoxy-L-arabinose-oxoglutarate aminotransferase